MLTRPTKCCSSRRYASCLRLFSGAVVAVLFSSWGFSAHRWSHEAAMQILPEPLFGFFKRNHDWVVQHAVDADLRKHNVIGEAEKHYIDLDRYDSVPPVHWTAAVELYGDSTLKANGIAPWAAWWTYKSLVKAFSEKDRTAIFRHAVDLGHYVGDLHVPLHTTENYNGQLTGQDGIHGLWETQLPEKHIETYDLLVGSALHRARFLDSPRAVMWGIAERSFDAVDSVLRFEADLTQSMGEAKKYAFVERGRSVVKQCSPDFIDAYAEALDGQVERRLQLTSQCIGDLWFSAWIEAGEPQLPMSIERNWRQRIWSWLWD
jgi:hypothetical protein